MVSKFDIIMYLETLFRKNINNITKEDMFDVTVISLEFIEYNDDEEIINFSDIIRMFPNLKRVILKNTNIDETIIDQLSIIKIESLEFDNCSLTNDLSLERLINLSEITISNCATLNFDFLEKMSNNLKKISIINPIDENVIDINKFTKYNELNCLILEKCIIYNIDSLTNFKNLRLLSLLWSDIDKIENSNVFLQIPNLKELYISECYCNSDFYQRVLPSIDVYQNLNNITLEQKEKS